MATAMMEKKSFLGSRLTGSRTAGNYSNSAHCKHDCTRHAQKLSAGDCEPSDTQYFNNMPHPVRSVARVVVGIEVALAPLSFEHGARGVEYSIDPSLQNSKGNHPQRYLIEYADLIVAAGLTSRPRVVTTQALFSKLKKADKNEASNSLPVMEVFL